jgi:predicted DNA-binding transcriptional regulator AlpA
MAKRDKQAPTQTPAELPATVWRKAKAGTFPQPVNLSAQVTAWRVEDVRAWMDARGAAKGAA